MTTRGRYILLSAIAWTCLTGCAHTRPTGARLSSSDATRIVIRAAQWDGIILSDYKRPRARFQPDGTWFVFFDGRGLFLTVGTDFAVIIDDRSREARVFPGM